LFRTNVEGLQHVLDAAVDSDLRRFVFTSSIGTIGIPGDGRPATEDVAMNGERYINSERFMSARELYEAADWYREHRRRRKSA
jgi:nucleoside-diphosphate-sugar epimerase